LGGGFANQKGGDEKKDLGRGHTPSKSEVLVMLENAVEAGKE